MILSQSWDLLILQPSKCPSLLWRSAISLMPLPHQIHNCPFASHSFHVRFKYCLHSPTWFPPLHYIAAANCPHAEFVNVAIFATNFHLRHLFLGCFWPFAFLVYCFHLRRQTIQQNWPKTCRLPWPPPILSRVRRPQLFLSIFHLHCIGSKVEVSWSRTSEVSSSFG